MPRSYLSGSHSKGQWFVISTVMVSAAFLMISLLFKQYFVVDASSMAKMDEDYYFWDVRDGLNKTVTIYGFADCNKLEKKLDEFIRFAEERTARMGYHLFVDKTTDCGMNSVRFDILLASDRMVINSTMEYK